MRIWRRVHFEEVIVTFNICNFYFSWVKYDIIQLIVTSYRSGEFYSIDRWELLNHTRASIRILFSWCYVALPFTMLPLCICTTFVTWLIFQFDMTVYLNLLHLCKCMCNICKVFLASGDKLCIKQSKPFIKYLHMHIFFCAKVILF